MVTPHAWGVEPTWRALLAGKSGAGRITAFDASTYACQVACEVPRVDGRGGGGPDFADAFDPDQVMTLREQRRVNDFILYAMAAADEAVRDSGWVPSTDDERERTGVNIGAESVVWRRSLKPPSRCTRRAIARSARSSSPRP